MFRATIPETVSLLKREISASVERDNIFSHTWNKFSIDKKFQNFTQKRSKMYFGVFYNKKPKSKHYNNLKLYMPGCKETNHVIKNKKFKLKLFSPGNKSDKDIFVIINKNIVTKLDKEIFINAIMSCKNGFNGVDIPGEFIFSNINGKILLIQVNSGLHKNVIECCERRKIPNIKLADLKKGKAYRNRNGETAVFLSLVDTETMTIRNKYDGILLKHLYSEIKYIDVCDYEFSFKKKNFSTLWFYYNENNFYDSNLKSQKEVQAIFNDRVKKNTLYPFKIRKTFSFFEEVENFKINTGKDIILKIRNNANYNFKNTNIKCMSYFDAYKLEIYSGLCNMSYCGIGARVTKIYKDLKQKII